MYVSYFLSFNKVLRSLFLSYILIFRSCPNSNPFSPFLSACLFHPSWRSTHNPSSPIPFFFSLPVSTHMIKPAAFCLPSLHIYPRLLHPFPLYSYLTLSILTFHLFYWFSFVSFFSLNTFFFLSIFVFPCRFPVLLISAMFCGIGHIRHTLQLIFHLFILSSFLPLSLPSFFTSVIPFFRQVMQYFLIILQSICLPIFFLLNSTCYGSSGLAYFLVSVLQS